MSASNNQAARGGGCGCGGAVIAAVLSYALNHSAAWSVFLFFCSWGYVLYALLCRHAEIGPAVREFFS